MSSSDVEEKSSRHQPASSKRAGSMPRAVGGSEKLALENDGSVRTTAIVSGGIEPTAASTWSGRRGADAPVGPDLHVRGVAVVLQHDRPVGRREHEQSHRQQQQQRRREAGAGGAPEPASGEVGGEPASAADAPVQPVQHERQQPQGDERGGEQQQRRRGEHEGLDRALARLGLRAAAQLDEGEDAERQHDQLDRHPGQQRAILARCSAAFLDHGARDRRRRERQQHERADQRHGEPEPDRAVVEPGGELDAGELLPVEPSGELGEPEPQQQPERERDRRVEQRLHALRREQRAAGEAAAVQHRELERLARERERAHAGEHGERHRPDLEHDEQDRHPQVLHAQVDEVEQRVEAAHHAGRRQAGLGLHRVLDLGELRRHARGLLERHAVQGEERVPRDTPS